MKEVKVRKFHRILGIIVVWFLMGQVFTGLILSIGDMAPGVVPQWLRSLLGTLHFGWDPLGGVYRLVLALATFALGISGIYIYFMIRARSQKT